MPSSPQNLGALVRIFINLALKVAPLILGLIVLSFFFGLALFVFGSDSGNKEQMSRGKSLMTWGVVAMFVVFSLWGLSLFVKGFFFPGGLPAGPPVPSSSVIQ